jgi:hypothetical protein
MVWVRERTIPTERPPLVGEVIANFLRIEWSAWRIPTAVFSVSSPDPLLLYQVAPQLYSRDWVDPVPLLQRVIMGAFQKLSQINSLTDFYILRCEHIFGSFCIQLRGLSPWPSWPPLVGEVSATLSASGLTALPVTEHQISNNFSFLMTTQNAHQLFVTLQNQSTVSVKSVDSIPVLWRPRGDHPRNPCF